MTGITNPAGTVTYGYNAAGEQTSMVQPEGTVTTGYDVNGFVDSVTDWRGDTFTMTNDADGRMLTAARSNGVDTSYSYDDAGRLTGVGHTGPNGGIDGFSYLLDPNGNRTAVVSNAGTEIYTLDALNRLTNASYPGGLSEAFAYDAAGNRTSHTKTDATTVGYTVDATGQLISDTSGTTYAYDAAGNLTGTSDGESYSYDDYGRHISISAGGVTQTYGYDAQDVRVTVDGQTQLWDRNGGLPTLISTSTGDNYVHTAGIARDGDGWLLADAVGSVRTVVDNTGAATGSQSFTAFGEQLTGSGTFGFAGEQQDPTGLQHLRARQYNPALGRFSTVDPIQPGAPGTTGYNLYAYAGNNPTTWTDPSGQSALGDYALLQVVRVQNAIAMSPAIQAVLAWIAAHPLALCAGGAGIGGAAYYYYSGNRTWGDAAIGALEGCEAGLSIYELADLLKGPQSRPNAGIAGKPEAGKLPQGISQADFDEASALIRASTDLGGDIVVQGSRVTGNAGPDSDIDIAIRVDQATFEQLVGERFGTPNVGSAKEQTLIMAVLQGRVHGGEAGLRPLRKRLEQIFGLDVDISVILRDGPFDESPTLPIGDS